MECFWDWCRIFCDKAMDYGAAVLGCHLLQNRYDCIEELLTMVHQVEIGECEIADVCDDAVVQSSSCAFSREELHIVPNRMEWEIAG